VLYVVRVLLEATGLHALAQQQELVLHVVHALMAKSELDAQVHPLAAV
jgi:hypothetical protein